MLAHHSSPQKVSRPTSKVVVPEGSWLLEPCAPCPWGPPGDSMGTRVPVQPVAVPQPLQCHQGLFALQPRGSRS